MNYHHDHDLDLVAALAGGWIEDDADRLVAEDQVDSCGACQTEFDLHGDVAGWLASAALVSLTDAERSDLRERVRAGISQGADVVSISDRSGRSTSRWLRLGSVAAALVVVAGVGGLLTQGGSDDTADAPPDAVAAESTDMTSALSREGADDDAGEAATALQADEAEEAESGGVGEDSAGSGSEDTLAAFGDVAAPVIEDATDHTVETLDERADAFTREIAGLDIRPLLTAEDFSAREAPTPECFTTEVEPAYGVLLTTLEGRPVQVYVVDDASGELTALALRPDESCSEVETP